MDFYVATYQDPLFIVRPIWFRTFVSMEVINPFNYFILIIFIQLLFQLPFFFAACYAIVKERNWIRVPGLLYSAHVCTTVAPVSNHLFLLFILLVFQIIATYYFSPGIEQSTSLIAMNLPYFILPLMWGIKMMKEKPFGSTLKLKKK